MYHDQRYRTARRLIRSFIIVKPLSVFPTYRILKAINRVDRAKKSPAKVGIKTYLKKKWSFRPLTFDSTPIVATAASASTTWSEDSLSSRVKRSLILSFELSTIFRRSWIDVWQAVSPAITCCNVLIQSREDIGVDEDEVDCKTFGLVLELRTRTLGGDRVLEIFDAV